MPPGLLTSADSTGHIHLVIGANSLAGSRCSKSLAVGAQVKLLTLDEEILSPNVSRLIANGEIEQISLPFSRCAATTLGRPEVDGIVDAVFVTTGGANPFSMSESFEYYIY